jgi:hypothetical protein
VQGGRASRPQALEHPRRRARRTPLAESHRFRDRQGARSASGRQRSHRRTRRNAGICQSGVDRRTGRCHGSRYAQRRLFAGRVALRAPRRRDALRDRCAARRDAAPDPRSRSAGTLDALRGARCRGRRRGRRRAQPRAPSSRRCARRRSRLDHPQGDRA